MRLNSIVCEAKTSQLLIRGNINKLYRLIEPIPNHPVRYDGKEFSASNMAIEMKTTTRHWWEEINQNAEPTENYIDFECPYGALGDLLWVKEPWASIDNDIYFKRDFLIKSSSIANNNLCQLIETIGWQTARSLDVSKAKIVLRITQIEVVNIEDNWLWALSIRVI